MNWAKCSYITGILFFVSGFIWWLVDLFRLFAGFYQQTGIDLLVLPLVRLLDNPLLWIGLILVKLAGRISGDADICGSDQKLQ